MDGMAIEVYCLEGGLAVIVIASAARQFPRVLGFIYLSGFFRHFFGLSLCEIISFSKIKIP
jgi:hypothetical protein